MEKTTEKRLSSKKGRKFNLLSKKKHRFFGYVSPPNNKSFNKKISKQTELTPSSTKTHTALYGAPEGLWAHWGP